MKVRLTDSYVNRLRKQKLICPINKFRCGIDNYRLGLLWQPRLASLDYTYKKHLSGVDQSVCLFLSIYLSIYKRECNYVTYIPVCMYVAYIQKSCRPMLFFYFSANCYSFIDQKFIVRLYTYCNYIILCVYVYVYVCIYIYIYI